MFPPVGELKFTVGIIQTAALNTSTLSLAKEAIFRHAFCVCLANTIYDLQKITGGATKKIQDFFVVISKQIALLKDLQCSSQQTVL